MVSTFLFCQRISNLKTCRNILSFSFAVRSKFNLIKAFLRTIPALGQTLFPLAIFLLFYAIIGLHLMQGAI